MKAEIDHLIRDYCIRLDDDSRTLSWSTTDQAASRRIRAMKGEIIARLRELGDQAVAANAAHVRLKALERIVQFRPPTQAERTLEARRKAAEDRMVEAQAILDQWGRGWIQPFIVWSPCIQFHDGENGPRLAVPSYLRLEVLWLLREINKPLQRPVPGPNWLDAPAGGGAA